MAAGVPLLPIGPNVGKQAGAGCQLIFGAFSNIIAFFVFVVSWTVGAPWYFIVFTLPFLLFGLGMLGFGLWSLIDIYQGRLEPGYPVQGRFRFQLPNEPWSFAGRFISIIWAIEVHVVVPMGPDLTHREPLVLRPRAARYEHSPVNMVWSNAPRAAILAGRGR